MQYTYSHQVWGSVLSFIVEAEKGEQDKFEITKKEAIDFADKTDQLFSTYKVDSEVSQIRRKELDILGAHSYVQEVWDKCQLMRDITDGAFDPWSLQEGFDPSGYVKGWAANKIVELFFGAGFKHIQIDAAGDLVLRGGLKKDIPWSIGVRNPENKDEIIRVFDLFDGAIATSGNYERGEHIRDPFTKLPAIGARSATVIGPAGGVADALATALMVAGREGSIWFTKQLLKDFSCWVVERNQNNAWGYGPAI